MGNIFAKSLSDFRHMLDIWFCNQPHTVLRPLAWSEAICYEIEILKITTRQN